ncbi:hypothetical protein G9A89_009771 [Geosiphon pyriformis]|nr:hypothetical protein G9A89_009771 [Geosiphon pyriformis]
MSNSKILFALFCFSILLSLVVESQAQNTSKNVTIPSPQKPSAPTSYELPDFSYNLAQKSAGERINICDTNKGYCITTCGGTGDKNFCNPDTMGWGCGCLDHVPNFQGYEWPINYADCIGRGQACNVFCQTDKVANADKLPCNVACMSTYLSKCGGPDQPAANYVVDDLSSIPTYDPPFSKNNKTNSTLNANNDTDNQNTQNGTNSDKKKNNAVSLSVEYYMGSIFSALAVVVFGMMAV